MQIIKKIKNVIKRGLLIFLALLFYPIALLGDFLFIVSGWLQKNGVAFVDWIDWEAEKCKD